MAEDDGREDGPAAAEGSEPEADAAEGAAPASADQPAQDDHGDDLEPDAAQQRETSDAFHVVYNVAGDHYGDLAEVRRRRRTGKLSVDDAREAVRGFVHPPHHLAARADLLERRLAVLAGEEGSGRRCAATSLLLELPQTDGSLVVLPPTKTVEDLGTHKFSSGGRYLLPDLPAGTGDAALRRHDVDLLVERLHTTNAYLVVTTSSTVGRKQFGDLVQPWRPVAAGDLIAAFLGEYPGAVDADGEKRLRDVCEPLTPATTRSVLRVVIEEGLETALASRSAMGQRAATHWFGGDPSERDVVRMALVAFVPFCDRRRYGLHLARLRELIARDQVAEDRTLRPEFVELREIPLISTEREADDGSRHTVIQPVSPEVHTAVVTELVDRYGPELLEPVRELQDELAGSRDGVTQLAVAYGMAVLARVDPTDVQVRLGDWAADLAPRRRSAAFALALMCESDSTADMALRIAMSWSTGAGVRRAATAATAFGLTLADRFPTHAVSYLWDLVLRSTAVSLYARQSLTALAQDSVRDTIALRDLLRNLDRQMCRLLDETPRRPMRVQRGTVALATVLTSPGQAGTEDGSDAVSGAQPGWSMSVVVLREHPDLVGRLGALWAHVLVSRPHRADAVRALRRDLDVLDPRRDAAAVERLGAEIRRRLTPVQWQWLGRDLPGTRWHW